MRPEMVRGKSRGEYENNNSRKDLIVFRKQNFDVLYWPGFTSGGKHPYKISKRRQYQ